jgi:predicted secreted protein
MNPQNGYVWEITSSTGKTWRVMSEGPNLEEAVSEFRRVHGYSEILYKVKYFAKYGELDA